MVDAIAESSPQFLGNVLHLWNLPPIMKPLMEVI